MKTLNNALRPILILAIILTIGFSGCKKNWFNFEENSGSTGSGGSTNTGNIIYAKGTVVNFECGKSIYNDGNNLWIKLDDGQMLQPCEQTFKTIAAIVLHDGDKVELKYHKYAGSITGFEFYCKIANFNYTRASIDYIGTIGSSTTASCPNVNISKDYDNQVLASANITDAKLVGTELQLNIGYSGCSKNPKRFGMIAKLLPTAGPLPVYEIKLIDNAPEMCMAAFTDIVCYDLSALKNLSNSSKISVVIKGTNTQFSL